MKWKLRSESNDSIFFLFLISSENIESMKSASARARGKVSTA